MHPVPRKNHENHNQGILTHVTCDTNMPGSFARPRPFDRNIARAARRAALRGGRAGQRAGSPMCRTEIRTDIDRDYPRVDAWA